MRDDPARAIARATLALVALAASLGAATGVGLLAALGGGTAMAGDRDLRRADADHGRLPGRAAMAHPPGHRARAPARRRLGRRHRPDRRRRRARVPAGDGRRPRAPSTASASAAWSSTCAASSCPPGRPRSTLSLGMGEAHVRVPDGVCVSTRGHVRRRRGRTAPEPPGRARTSRSTTPPPASGRPRARRRGRHRARAPRRSTSSLGGLRMRARPCRPHADRRGPRDDRARHAAAARPHRDDRCPVRLHAARGARRDRRRARPAGSANEEEFRPPVAGTPDGGAAGGPGDLRATLQPLRRDPQRVHRRRLRRLRRPPRDRSAPDPDRVRPDPAGRRRRHPALRHRLGADPGRRARAPGRRPAARPPRHLAGRGRHGLPDARRRAAAARVGRLVQRQHHLAAGDRRGRRRADLAPVAGRAGARASTARQLSRARRSTAPASAPRW